MPPLLFRAGMCIEYYKLLPRPVSLPLPPPPTHERQLDSRLPVQLKSRVWERPEHVGAGSALKSENSADVVQHNHHLSSVHAIRMP
eukprot:229897-Chlamydomonas_euryale.AAC.3